MNNSMMKLQGKFVEDCLWTPTMYYAGVDEITSYSPTPTRKIGSPFSYYLNNTGELISWMHVSKLSLSCGMDFSLYPFDIQVNHIFISIEINSNFLKEL